MVIEIEDCNMIQTRSAKLMNFLIQDLLDFAMIKAGKLRINLEEFNIREAFEEVMSIQMEQAIRKGIGLSITYVNISESLNALSRRNFDQTLEIFSPMIKSDVSRIQ
jgi:signal transduction histidine kinase